MDIEKYKLLISNDNYTKEKYMAFVESVLDTVVNQGSMVESMDDAFDIMNAAGDQLDIIGELVGVSRLLPFVPLIGNREMDDDEYRVAIFMKIFRNEWDGTTASAVSIYKSAFQDICRIEFYDDDEETCNVIVNIYAQSDTRIAEILNSTGTLLIPIGVGMTVNVVDNEVTIEFGASANVVGAVTYAYAETIDDEAFTVGDIEDMTVADVQWRYVRRLQR